MNIANTIPEQLQDIIDQFQDSDRQEKLELLLEFSDQLPPLPEQYREHVGMEQVHECMSPVFVVAERAGANIVFHFDVPPEAPTTRGYASILAAGLNGLTPEAVLGVPSDFFQAMGLHEILSPQRLNGITAMLAYVKRQALQVLEA
jgi:cysteine desulfuration protein SufE